MSIHRHEANVDKWESGASEAHEVGATQRRPRRRFAALLLAVAMAAAAFGVVASPAPAEAKYRACGWTNCTDYLTKAETRMAWSRIQNEVGTLQAIVDLSCGAFAIAAGMVGGAMSAPSGPLAAAVALGVGAAAAIGCLALKSRLQSQLDTLRRAAASGQCYQLTFARYGSNNPLLATGWGMTNNRSYCW